MRLTTAFLMSHLFILFGCGSIPYKTPGGAGLFDVQQDISSKSHLSEPTKSVLLIRSQLDNFEWLPKNIPSSTGYFAFDENEVNFEINAGQLSRLSSLKNVGNIIVSKNKIIVPSAENIRVVSEEAKANLAELVVIYTIDTDMYINESKVDEAIVIQLKELESEYIEVISNTFFAVHDSDMNLLFKVESEPVSTKIFPVMDESIFNEDKYFGLRDLVEGRTFVESISFQNAVSDLEAKW